MKFAKEMDSRSTVPTLMFEMGNYRPIDNANCGNYTETIKEIICAYKGEVPKKKKENKW